MIEWVLAIGLVLAAMNLLVLYGITHQHRDRIAALETTIGALKAVVVLDGICGDESPVAVGSGAVMVCDLPYGHKSEWHSGDRDELPPMRWRNRGLCVCPEWRAQDPSRYRQFAPHCPQHNSVAVAVEHARRQAEPQPDPDLEDPGIPERRPRR